MRKWTQILLIPIAILLMFATTMTTAQEKKSERSIAEFEDEKSIAGKRTSHKASVTLVEEVPEGGGKLAVKTVVDSDAGTKNYFGTGFKIPIASDHFVGLMSHPFIDQALIDTSSAI